MEGAMNERLEELKKLWNQNFDGELTPAENVRLAELMSDSELMEVFARSQADASSGEAQPSLSEAQWATLDAKVIRAFRKSQSSAWLRPLYLVLAAGLAAATGVYLVSEKPQPRPDLASSGEAFQVVSQQHPEGMARRAEPSQEPAGSHMVHAAQMSVIVDQSQSGPATVSIFNGAGVLVRKIFTGELAVGKHRFQWNGTDSSGLRVNPGTYTIEIRSSTGTERRQVEIRQKK
jgi:hypothetical protein